MTVTAETIETAAASPAASLEFRAGELTKGITAVKHAVDVGHRPILAGVLFEGDAAGFRLVASDGYRIALAELPPADGAPADFGRSIVRFDDVKVLLALLRPWPDSYVRITFDREGEELVFALTSGQTLTVRPMVGTFPDYRTVVINASDDKPEVAAVSLNAAFLKGVAEGAAAMGEVTVRARIVDPLAPIAVRGLAGRYAEYVMPVRTWGGNT